MEIVRRHILKHVDGYPVNIRYEPVKTIRAAARLSEDDFETLMTGYYRPLDRKQYYLQEIEVTYREVENNVQEEREHQQISDRASESTKRD